MRPLVLLILASCTAVDIGAHPNPLEVQSPEVRELREVVPMGLPPMAPSQVAHNNLDVTWHQGRLFLAYRTAPSHFASPFTQMVVVSTEDEETWRYEGSFSLDTDLREPHLVSSGDTLWLYFAVLGTSAIDFEPQGAVFSRYLGPESWTAITWLEDRTFIPWRIKEMNGQTHMIGYSGGAGVYEPGGDPIRVQWFVLDDASRWVPAVGSDPVVLEGGGSETDLVILEDGSLVAVVRNEAGDEQGFGSKICRAPAEALDQWTCAHDPRKYDSPLLFRRGGDVWLVARRNVSPDGHYDLGLDDLDLADQYYQYQLAYWNLPKRCALWRIDPDAQTATWALDLPSKGDTCFPEAVDLEGSVLLYNYSNDPEGPDWTWLEGQFEPTGIYRQILHFAD